MASLALALLLGRLRVSSEQMAEPQATFVSKVTLVPLCRRDLPGVFVGYRPARFGDIRTPDQDAVLVNLVTYREQ